LGSPTDKLENMSQLLRDHSMDVRQTVLLGDSRHDFSAAATFGIHFFLVTRYIPFESSELVREVTDYGGRIVESLCELV